MKKIVFSFLAVVVFASLCAFFYYLLFYHRVIPVKVARVEWISVHSSVNTNGKVEADEVYELRAPFAAPCRAILAREGENLKAGRAVVELDDSLLQSDLAGARAELKAAEVDLSNIHRGPSREEITQAEAESARASLELEGSRKILETNEWLLKKSAITRFEVEQSRRDVERFQQVLDAAKKRLVDLKARFTEDDRNRAVARVEAARSRIKYLEDQLARGILRAPVDGNLFQFSLKAGAFLNTGELAGLVGNLSHLRIRAFVDEPDLGQVVPGAEVIVRWDARPDLSWKGTVRHIPTQVVALASRSVAEVLCSIQGSAGPLIPNLNIDVEILTPAGPKVPTLPRNTVFPDGKSHYVWTINDGMVAKRSIQTGRSTSNLIEVSKGLAVGDRVIIPGVEPLAEGMRIRVTEE